MTELVYISAWDTTIECWERERSEVTDCKLKNKTKYGTKMIDLWLVLCQIVLFADVLFLTSIEYQREEQEEATGSEHGSKDHGEEHDDVDGSITELCEAWKAAGKKKEAAAWI